MMAQETYKPQRFQKTKKFFRAAWRLTKTVVKISPLVAAPLFAQEKDTTKAADEAFFKGSLAAKSIVRVYDTGEGKSRAAGAGFVGGIEMGKTGNLEVTFTGVKQRGTTGIIAEEASISAIVPAGPVVIIPYVYKDLYFSAPGATYGVAVKGFGAKIGGDVGQGFWVGYAKYSFGLVTVGAAAVGWGEDGSMHGPVQKVAFDFNTNATVGKVTVSGEARYGIVLDSGAESTVFRVTVAVPIF